MSDSWGSPAPLPPPRRRGIQPRHTAWIIAGVVVAVLLLRTHHISRFTVIYFCVLIPSIILHEVSHGVVANIFGDDTAKRAGRLTLNPIPHIDLFGSIILPALLVLSGSVAFGWAKPVPVNVSRLRHPRNDSVWVSLAGPFTNALLFVICGLVFRYSLDHGLFLSPTSDSFPLGYQILLIGGLANITVGVFNLIPIPPLDGSVLVERLLPNRAMHRYYQMRPVGMILVFLVALFAFQNSSVQYHLLNGELDIWNAVGGTHFIA
jgi:Zn-dependent protease